jgi:hypothetical protein
MGLTKRQAQAVEQIIVEESRAAHQSQQDRHRILSEVDEPGTITQAKAQVLASGVAGAIDDLVESFAGNNRVYEGVEFDRGTARARAVQYLRRLIENDVREVQQMLHEGDFEMDQGYDEMDQAGGMMANMPMDQDSMPSMGGSSPPMPGGSSPSPSGMDEEELDEKTPPGGEKVVRALKKQKGVKNPWAVAWSMKNRGEI